MQTIVYRSHNILVLRVNGGDFLLKLLFGDTKIGFNREVENWRALGLFLVMRNTEKTIINILCNAGHTTFMLDFRRRLMLYTKHESSFIGVPDNGREP